MKPEVRTPDNVGIDTDEITPTQLFSVFAQNRCQIALAYLAHRGTAISLGDLAEYIAITEGEQTQERYERVCTDLFHAHLPRMTDLGLVQYDAERELVQLDVDREIVLPYLELADRVDA